MFFPSPYLLAARREDIADLANAFLTRSLEKIGRSLEPFGAEALTRLKNYDWPGNVRELQNVIERSVIVADDSHPNLDRALPILKSQSGDGASNSLSSKGQSGEKVLTVSELEELEKQNILVALETCNWRIAGDNGAAKL